MERISYPESIRELVIKSMKQLVAANVKSICGSTIIGIVREAAGPEDEPLETAVVREILKMPQFLTADTVHPDHTELGTAYRDMPYMTVIGDVKFGMSPSRRWVRMDLTQAMAPV